VKSHETRASRSRSNRQALELSRGFLTEIEVQCATCSRRFKAQWYHAGFSDVVAFTCDRDSSVLMVSLYDKKIESLLGRYPNYAWTASQFKTIESNLRACPCGGTFRHDAKSKCPNCGAILHAKLGPVEFLVVDRLIDGAEKSPWR
jgi:hypothetical protein